MTADELRYGRDGLMPIEIALTERHGWRVERWTYPVETYRLNAGERSRTIPPAYDPMTKYRDIAEDMRAARAYLAQARKETR